MHEEVLAFINSVLIGEKVAPVAMSTTLDKLGIDSFGYIVVWMALEERYGRLFSPLAITELCYETTTISDVIERIINAQNHQS